MFCLKYKTRGQVAKPVGVYVKKCSWFDWNVFILHNNSQISVLVYSLLKL